MTADTATELAMARGNYSSEQWDALHYTKRSTLENEIRGERIAAIGLEYKAEFVPQSRSRNQDDTQPCLNWKITISKGRASITTDYMQGCAHCPAYKKFSRDKFLQTAAIKGECETGRVHKEIFREQVRETRDRVPAPLLRDVLYSLAMDADVLNHASYEEWAGNFGYDEDSRKGEKTYNDCMKIALQLKQIACLEDLQQIFEGY